MGTLAFLPLWPKGIVPLFGRGRSQWKPRKAVGMTKVQMMRQIILHMHHASRADARWNYFIDMM